MGLHKPETDVSRTACGLPHRRDFAAQILDLRMALSESRFPSISASKTRVNALMIKSGTGIFQDMRYWAGNGVLAWTDKVLPRASVVFRWPPK
jgi:hypothetical protein